MPSTQTDGSSLGRFMIVLACFVVVVAGMQAASSIIVPFLSAVFLTILCLPGLHMLQRRGVPTGLALTIVLAGMVVIAAIVVFAIGSSLSDFQQDLGRYTDSLEEKRRAVIAWLEARDVDFPDEVDDAIDPRTVLGYIGTAVGQLGGLMSNALLILLLVAFLLAEAGCFAAKLRAVAKDPDAADDRVHRVMQSVSQYFSIKTVVSLVTGVLVGVLLWIVGVPYPVLWAFLAFLLNFVPTIGSILAAVPPVLLALVEQDLGAGPAGVVAAGFVVINLVIGNVVEPRLMGRGLDLSTLVVFLSLMFWGWVLGPIGMLLSVPLTATVKIILEGFPESRAIARMLGSGEPTEA